VQKKSVKISERDCKVIGVSRIVCRAFPAENIGDVLSRVVPAEVKVSEKISYV
jgi:hypothetical protein